MEPVARTLIGDIDYSEGAITSKVVLKSAKGNVTLFSFDVDQELSEHTAPFDALVQIVEGQASIIIDGKEYTLNAGQYIILPANIPHAVKALSRFKMVLTMIRD